jgi:hypothetical protein
LGAIHPKNLPFYGQKILSITTFFNGYTDRRIDCARITGNILQNPFDKISVFQINLKQVIKAKFYVDICTNYFQKQR